jgi:predicted XRE-type DNA-binding protein
MRTKTERIVELLKSGVQDIRYLAEIGGDRHVVDVPINIIEKHPDLTKVRAEDPPDLSLLRDSMRTTSGPIYPPCVFIELQADELIVFVADGHQRLDAAKSNGDQRIQVQYIARWDTVEKALTDIVSLQFARYEMVEADVVSLIRSGKMTQAQIAKLTGFGESRVSRLAKIAGPDTTWLYQGVTKGVMNLGQAGKLVDACGGNRDKLAAFRNTFEAKYAQADEQATFWANRMKSVKRKWDKKTREKARVATYFKDVDWTAWEGALADDDGLERADGKLSLKLEAGTASTKSGVRIGDATDWEKEFALYGLFERKISDVESEDLDYVLANWDHLRDVLIAIRDGTEVPPINPVKDVSPPDSPAPQRPQMTVVGRTSDGE